MGIEHFDVVVVGAGPAGAAAALAARRAGAGVLLLDRATSRATSRAATASPPRRSTSWPSSASPDVRAATRRPAAAAGRRPAAVAVARALPRPAYTVPRQVFDARLVAAAVAAGAELRRHTVRGSTHGRTVVARRALPGRGGDRRGRGRLGGAAGAGPAGQPARAPGPGDPRVRADGRTRPSSSSSPRDARWPAYAWAFPIGDGTANVGYGEVLRGRAADPRVPAGPAARVCCPAPSRPALRAHHLPLSTQRPAPGRGRILLAGDALSLINPFTGEGIFYARALRRAGRCGGGRRPGPGRRSGTATALRRRLGRHLRHSGSRHGWPGSRGWSTPRSGRPRRRRSRSSTGWWSWGSATEFSTFARSGASSARRPAGPRLTTRAAVGEG